MANEETWSYEPVPKAAVHLFRMVWQLETWLRNFVYVELRAARMDWETPIKTATPKWPPPSLMNDKRLHHMATPHQNAISYLTLSELWKVISTQWPLFAPYFPPKQNVEVRMDEIKAIRNRVAHFRMPHANDVARMELFMRDMEPGVRLFCSRYTTGKVPTDPADDPVTERLAQSWPVLGSGVELWRPDRGWLYAVPHRMNPRMNASLELLTHPQFQRGSLAGVIYKLTMHSSQVGKIDTVTVVESTKDVHKDIIHFIVDESDNQVSVTIPAVPGVEATVELLGKFIHIGVNCITHAAGAFSDVRARWPEYVLRSNNLLAFFDDSISEPLLDLTRD